MIAQTVDLEIVKTETEAEALLLESDLIKRYAPRYNILLRDDKSFPMILVTGDHDYPQIVKYRGARNRSGEYFGPFASVWAVNDTLGLLQRAFLLRTCSDNVFANRTRPCLLFQIKRCSGPCVGRISKVDYKGLVDEAREFLTGDSQRIQRKLAENMQAASDDQEYEMAAHVPGPHPGPDTCAVPPRSLQRRIGGSRCYCPASGRRSNLRAGLLLSWCPQLREPCVFPEPCP